MWKHLEPEFWEKNVLKKRCGLFFSSKEIKTKWIEGVDRWKGDSPRKKNESRESHSYNPIRDSGETLVEREKSRQEFCKKSHRESWRESRLDSWWDSRQDSGRVFSRSPSIFPESRIGLYAWLFARLSPRLVFYAEGRTTNCWKI